MPAGMNVAESFTPHARLKRDSTRSPTVASSAVAAPSAPATGYVSTSPTRTDSPQPKRRANARNTHAVAAEKKPVKIYASRYQRGWGALSPVSWIDRNVANLTTSDRWAANGEKIIGVYRGGAEAPLGKALIIHRPNEWDTKPGLSIFVR